MSELTGRRDWKDLDETITCETLPRRFGPTCCYPAVVQKNDRGMYAFLVANIFWSLVFSLVSVKPSMIFLASCSSSPHTIITASPKLRLCLQFFSGVEASRSACNTGYQFSRPAGKTA